MMRKGSWSSRKWKAGVKKGPWTGEEDEALRKYIEREGEGRWRTLPKRAGLQRCGKSCRLRWMNYLRPCVKRGHIAPDEEDLILRLHRLLGNRWSLIAGRIPGRTDNEIKNYWNSHLSKKLIRQGIDPRTHKPLSSSSHSPTPPPPTATVEHHNKKPPPPPPPAAAIGSSSSSHMMMEPYIHITTPPSSSSDALDPCHPLQHDHDHPLPFPNINMPPTFSTGTTDNDNDDVFSSFLNSLINDHDDPFSNPTPPPL